MTMPVSTRVVVIALLLTAAVGPAFPAAQSRQIVPRTYYNTFSHAHEVLARIAKEARVPVYNQGGTHVGLGIVGGVVFNPESLGRETAQLALRELTFRWAE